MLITALYQQIIRQLSSIYDEDESKAIAKELIEFYAAIPLQKSLDTVLKLSEDVVSRIQDALIRLEKREPLQYVLEEAWFYGLPFYVNKHVLIPRPETEELVALILNAQTTNHQPPTSILDIGTGSGCIPIALKKNLPQATVYGMDVSKDALDVANRNANRNKVEVQFVEDNILSSKFEISNSKSQIRNLKSEISNLKLDIIVSNPPYITEEEKAEMHPNVLTFEPHLALFVTDKNPLQFYEAITLFAKNHLAIGGKLYFEINASYGNEVKALMEMEGFSNVFITNDMQGKNRFVSGELY